MFASKNLTLSIITQQIYMLYDFQDRVIILAVRNVIQSMEVNFLGENLCIIVKVFSSWNLNYSIVSINHSEVQILTGYIKKQGLLLTSFNHISCPLAKRSITC